MTERMSIDDRVSTSLRAAAGVFGVAARHMETDRRILINEDEVFPAASVIKVPILVELFCRRDEGRLSLDETVELRDECKVDGSGILKELHPGLELNLRNLASLMIVISDNTATNMMLDWLGMDSVNERMGHFGLKHTVLARKMYDFEQAALGRENLCTAGDMMLLLGLLADGQISSKNTSIEMLEIMARQQYREAIPLRLPEDIRVANKTGSIPGVVHDVAVVYGACGPYVICVMTRGVTDKAGAERAIGKASEVVHDHFCSSGSSG